MITISRERVALACATGLAMATRATTTTSFNGTHHQSGPTSKDDPRLGQPRFYKDDGDGGWWTHASTPGVN